jgi:hypothetical protein
LEAHFATLTGLKRTVIAKRYLDANQALQDRLLDRSALKDRWDCSLESLKRFEKSGILRPLKIGAKVKYRLSDIVEAEKEAEVVA